MLKTLTTGFGYVAFAGLAARAADTVSPSGGQPAGPADSSLLLPKQPHFPAKAKRIIFLGMEGGPSHVDTFDYKVKLQADDGRPSKDNEDREYLGSTFKFKQYGQSGKWISELFPNVAEHADELCFLHGMWTNAPALLLVALRLRNRKPEPAGLRQHQARAFHWRWAIVRVGLSAISVFGHSHWRVQDGHQELQHQ